MTPDIYTTVIVALFLAWLAYERHAARRHDELVVGRLADLAMIAAPEPRPSPDLTALIALVENLAQRLQAPAAAVAMHAAAAASDPLYAPPAVSTEDDADYWEAKEEMAERLAAQERAAVG